MEQPRIPIEVYAESTPNPNVMKFVANRRLVMHDGLEFRSPEAAQKAPLVQQLFQFPFVREVFLSANFVAIAKFDTLDWLEISQELRYFVRNWLSEGRPILSPDFDEADLTSGADSSSSNAETPAPADPRAIPMRDPAEFSVVELQVAALLDEYVSPAVAQDGGMIRLISVEGRTAKVLLQGACSGCPSSTATLQQGVKNLLVKMLPSLVEEVEAVNG
ncbi:NifU family protein [bacterium]|nr:NifU family protein [bacterium]